jgi:hypothetical protein
MPIVLVMIVQYHSDTIKFYVEVAGCGAGMGGEVEMLSCHDVLKLEIICAKDLKLSPRLFRYPFCLPTNGGKPSVIIIFQKLENSPEGPRALWI